MEKEVGIKLIFVVAADENFIPVSHKTKSCNNLPTNAGNKIISDQERKRHGNQDHNHNWWDDPIETPLEKAQ